MKKLFSFVLMAFAFVLVVPHPAGSTEDSFEKTTALQVTQLGADASAHMAAASAAGRAPALQSWNIASNNSNAGEIYSLLIRSGGGETCADKRLVINGDPQTVKDCAVTARVAHLTVVINDIIWGSKTDVDVQGDTNCQAEWLAIARGRHQVAERWHFCQFKGVVAPKN